MYFYSEEKKKRAENVINAPATFEGEAVERKALAIAQGEGKTGEALLVRVYQIIGGKVDLTADAPVVVEPKKKAKK